jgi:hypothetical protein
MHVWGNFKSSICPVSECRFQTTFCEQKEQFHSCVSNGSKGVGLACASGTFEEDVDAGEEGDVSGRDAADGLGGSLVIHGIPCLWFEDVDGTLGIRVLEEANQGAHSRG